MANKLAGSFITRGFNLVPLPYNKFVIAIDHVALKCSTHCRVQLKRHPSCNSLLESEWLLDQTLSRVCLRKPILT